MRTLLLNNTFQPLSFINEKKALRLLIKGKAETLAIWAGATYTFGSGSIELPAVLRMNYQISRNFHRLGYSRNAIFKRDQFQCQYCSKQLTLNNITIDHVLPKCRGGQNTFTNCVSACKECNLGKGTRTPEEAGMKLTQQPITPKGYLILVPNIEQWHEGWDYYLNAA